MLDEEIKIIKSLLQDKPLLELIYEEDIYHNPVAAYNKVCDFTGIQRFPVKVDLKKPNPFPVMDLVSNYKEVKHYFKDAPYAWMVNE